MMWAVVPVSYALGTRRDVIIIGLAGATLVAIILEITRARSSLVGTMFRQATGFMLREHEHHRWSGATWLLLSFLLVSAVLDAPAAIAAMWAIAIGDASAAIVGRTVGRTRISGAAKTVEGSVACAATTMLGAVFVAGLPTAIALGAGISAALAEWPARPLDDNVRIGLGVGAGILLCRMVFS
jgi:dolichol kinase